MHIPSFQSLIYLSLLTVPYVSAVPLDENIQPRAASKCNAKDITTLKHAAKQPEQYCKSWLASKHDKSTVKGLNVAQVSSACKCVKASASSSSVAAAKKTAKANAQRVTSKKTTPTKKATSTKRPTISAKKSTATKKATSTLKKLTSKKATASPKVISTKKSSSAVKPVTVSKKSSKSLKKVAPTVKSSTNAHSTSASTTSSVSSSSKDLSSSTSSVLSIATSSTSITSSSASSATSSVDSSVGVSTTGASSALRVAPNSATTRSGSSGTASSSGAVSTSTSSVSSNTRVAPTDPQAADIIVNGNFSGGSYKNWRVTHAAGTQFSVASLENNNINEAIFQYDLAGKGNALTDMYQDVVIPAEMSYQLILDVFINYPNGLPQGVACVVKYSLGGDSGVINQYGVAPSSQTKFSDSASGQTINGFTGRLRIGTYCNSVSSSSTSFTLGFGNIQLFVFPTPVVTSTSSSAVAAATSSCVPSVPTNTNLVNNGDFSSGSMSGWNIDPATVGQSSISVQPRSGTSNNYAVMNLTPTQYNEANAQMSQTLQIVAGYAYNFSADIYFNDQAGLPSNAVCAVTYQVGSTAIDGYEIGSAVARANGNHLTNTHSGTIADSDCNASFQVYVDCFNITSPITIGFDNIQLVLQSGSASSGASPSGTSASKKNIIRNGDFASVDYSNWGLFRLGDTTFAIQGSKDAYVSTMNFTAGGDYNSRAALMQQAVTLTAGKTYTLNMGLLLDYPNALPNDNSRCDLQVYIVDANGYGIALAQMSYGYGDAAFQTVTGSDTVNNGFSGYFGILLRCYGGAKPIIAGLEDIQVFES